MESVKGDKPTKPSSGEASPGTAKSEKNSNCESVTKESQFARSQNSAVTISLNSATGGKSEKKVKLPAPPSTNIPAIPLEELNIGKQAIQEEVEEEEKKKKKKKKRKRKKKKEEEEEEKQLFMHSPKVLDYGKMKAVQKAQSSKGGPHLNGNKGRTAERGNGPRNRNDRRGKAAGNAPDEGHQGNPRKKYISKPKWYRNLNTFDMDAVLENADKSIAAGAGESFVKVYAITNVGTVPWTTLTNVVLCLCDPELQFEKEIVKCPPLAPQERGEIEIKGKAPCKPGTFDSYWQLFHAGQIFGPMVVISVAVS